VSSIAFQHANHSVRVSDEFMRLSVEGGEWALRAVTTGEVVETIPARRLLRACAEAAHPSAATPRCCSRIRSRASSTWWRKAARL
jgi:hypothetical protein